MGERTIHEWANEIRQRAREVSGEKHFAKSILFFDQNLAGGGEQDKFANVMQILVEGDNAYLMQLAIVWLDGAGYGAASVAGVQREINQEQDGRT